MNDTVQRILEVDEEYPVYHLSNPDLRFRSDVADAIPVPADLAARYEAALTEWREVQRLLDALDAQNREDRQ